MNKNGKYIKRPWLPSFAAVALATLGGVRLSAEDARAAALRQKVTRAVLAKWSPELHFHVLEHFFPTSIEDLVKGAKRYQDGDPKENPARVTKAKAIPITHPNDLRDLGPEWRILYDPANPKVKGGDRGPGGSVTAPMYVAVQIPADGSYVKLVYRFLFGFNGAQSMRSHDGTGSFNYTAPKLAEHEGDWEGVNVMLNADLTSVIAVTTESHGNSVDHLVDDLDWSEGTHCQIRSALNSHGIYNGKGKNPNDWIILEGLGVMSVIDIITRDGPVWQPWKQQNNPFRLIGRIGGTSVGNEAWATFRGRMGSYKTNDINRPTDVDGGRLNAIQTFKAEGQSFVIKSLRTFGALGDTRIGAPCSGPGGRSDMNLELPGREPLKAHRSCAIFSRIAPHNLVLSLDPANPDGPVIMATHRKGDPLQRWYLEDVGHGRTQILNVQTGKSLRLLPGGNGKPVAMYSPLVRSAWNVWTLKGDRKTNCAIRPVVTDSQNLTAFGKGPYKDGNPVGTWVWHGGDNETWRIVED